MGISIYQVLKGLLITQDSTLTPNALQITPGGSPGTTTSIVGSQTANRTLTLPDATDTLVARATTDTLSNKTLIAPTIATINNGGTLTLPTGPDTLVARTSTDTLTNKTIADALTMAGISTPSTPSSGFGKIYFKSDGFLYQLNSAGQESRVGSGGAGTKIIGGGVISYSAAGGTPVNYSNPPNTGTTSTGLSTSDNNFGFSFVAPQNGSISTVTFDLLRVGPSPSGNIACAVYTGVGGGGGTGLLGTSASVDASTIATFPGANQTFTFSSPVTVTSGTTYYILVIEQGGFSISGFDAIEYYQGSSGTGYVNGVSAPVPFYSLALIPAANQMTFTASMFLEMPTLNYSDNTILTSQGPVVFPSAEYAAWVNPNLATGGPNLTITVSALSSVPRTGVIIARTDVNGDLIVGASSSRLKPGESTELYYTQNEIPVVKYLDPIATSLPTGASYTVDGSAAVNGDLILFTNLASGNNEIYQISGVGTSIVFTAQFLYKYKSTPSDGQKVVVTHGTAFSGQTAIYSAASNQFTVNNIVRLFNTVSANYWELGSIQNLGLPDNATTQVFSVTATGSENMILSFSVSRGTSKDTGLLMITTNDTTVSISEVGPYISSTGVSFSAVISTGNLILSATTTSTGTAANMKYFLQRWSDAATGGPGGIPNYSPSAVSASAFCIANSSGTPYNCTNPTLIGGLSTVQTSFNYLTGLNPGATVGNLDVYVNGQRIPRFVSSAVTPPGTGTYYTEYSSNQVQFSANLSSFAYTIEILRKL